MIILPIERNSTEAKILHVEIWAPENFYDDAKFGDEDDYADNADYDHGGDENNDHDHVDDHKMMIVMMIVMIMMRNSPLEDKRVCRGLQVDVASKPPDQWSW